MQLVHSATAKKEGGKKKNCLQQIYWGAHCRAAGFHYRCSRPEGWMRDCWCPKNVLVPGLLLCKEKKKEVLLSWYFQTHCS